MVDQTRKGLQQKMSLGFMEEKTYVEATESLGSSKTLKQEFIDRNILDKSNFHPPDLSLHNIYLEITLFKVFFKNIKIHVLYCTVFFIRGFQH